MPEQLGIVLEGERTNEGWLRDLSAEGEAFAAAVEDLREYLLKATFLYYHRRRSDLSHLAREELSQMAEDAAQDALLMILNKLDTFRGDSKFTTWAYRVAINRAASELRRRKWSDLSLDALDEMTNEESPSLLTVLEDPTGRDPDAEMMRRQIWEIIHRIIEEEFTDRQRMVFINQYFHGVPPDVIAEQLNTNRNNIYKIAHDGRLKLKKHLLAQGLTENDVLAIFQAK